MQGSEYGDWGIIRIPFDKAAGVWEYDIDLINDWRNRIRFRPIKGDAINYSAINNYYAYITGDEYDFMVFNYKIDQYDDINLLSTDQAGISGNHTIKIEINEEFAALSIDDVPLGEPYLNPPEATAAYMDIEFFSATEAPVYLDEVRFSEPALLTVLSVDLSMDVPVVTAEESLEPAIPSCGATFNGEIPTITTTSHLPFQSTYESMNPSIHTQRNIQIDAVTCTSTYECIDSIIGVGAGVNSDTLNVTLPAQVPEIYYGYQINTPTAYSRYQMYHWEEEQADTQTIFPQIVIKQIKKVFIQAIRK
jgi:hypothetical protein